MNKQKPPAIIIGDELIKNFDDGIEKLNQVLENITTYNNIGGTSAAALYAYSIFEGTLYVVYSKILRAFPKKAELEYKKIDKELLFGTSRTSVVIDRLCKNFSKDFGHENFRSYINTFNKIVSIDIAKIPFPYKILDEYKKSRNYIAHRGHEISLNDTILYIKAAKETLLLIREKFILKYQKYSDVQLIKNSCAYIFNMSEREFKECFEFFDNHVSIKREPIENFYGRLSSSEAHCFLLFIANYNAGMSSEFKIRDLMPRVSLTDDTIDRISFINDLFEAYPHLINR